MKFSYQFRKPETNPNILRHLEFTHVDLLIKNMLTHPAPVAIRMGPTHLIDEKNAWKEVRTWQYYNTEAGNFCPVLSSLKSTNFTNDMAILTLGGLNG